MLNIVLKDERVYIAPVIVFSSSTGIEAIGKCHQGLRTRCGSSRLHSDACIYLWYVPWHAQQVTREGTFKAKDGVLWDRTTFE
jgi:hypothetical protein